MVGHDPGSGRLAGKIGALVCKARNKNLFKVGSGFSDAEREKSKAPKIGSVITYKFFELSSSGNPRFPTFLRVRPDVSAAEFD